MSLDPKAKEWSFLSKSSYLNLSQINLQMAEGHVLPNGATFCRTQGRWFFLNYQHLYHVLNETVSDEIAISIIRLVLDLSFERHGALLAVLDNASCVGQVITDHTDHRRVNIDLRKTVSGLNLLMWPQRQVVFAACKSDGALILTRQGAVADVACMIGDPSSEALKKAGFESIQRYAGARSTAAWNSSIYGTAIKISEDGPITMFRHGKVVASLG